MKYDELIKQISQKELKKSLYYSQALFLFIGLFLAFVFFKGKIDWINLLSIDIYEIAIFGIGLASVIVIVELILYRYVDPKHFDDGGLNEKLFKGLPVYEVFLIALVVAICEEVLFRGVIQSVFGYIIASTVFALMHYRYLKKILLFSLLVVISFILGYIFEQTNNLLVTIAFHFTMDFLLGIYIAKSVR